MQNIEFFFNFNGFTRKESKLSGGIRECESRPRRGIDRENSGERGFRATRERPFVLRISRIDSSEYRTRRISAETLNFTRAITIHVGEKSPHVRDSDSITVV